MALGSEIRAGAAFVELKSKDNGFSRGLKSAQRRLDRFGASAKRIGRGLVAGGGSIVVAGALATRIFAKMGDELDKVSRRTGFAVETLSELGFAAEQSGANLKTLEKGIKASQRSINDAGRGLSTQVDALKDLGLEYENLANLSPEDQFFLIADRLSKIEDPSKRAALAMQLLGRAGQALLPLFEGGVGGMEKLRQQARDLGLVISTESAQAAAELTDRLNIMRRVLKVVVFEIGAALAPAVIQASKIVTRIAISTGKWIRENKSLVVTVASVAGVVTVLGVGLIGVGLAASIVAFAFGGLAAAIGLVGTIAGVAGGVLSALVSPIALVLAGVTGLAGFIATRFINIGEMLEVLKTVFGRFGAAVGDALGAIVRSIIGGDLELAVKIAGKAMEIAWAGSIGRMKSAWIDFMSLFKVASGGTLIGLGFNDAGKKLIKSGVDSSSSNKDKLTNELKNLTDQLKALENKAPNDPTGPLGARKLFEALTGFNQASTAASVSARGVFDSSALRSLSSPVEKSIAKNTADTAQGIVQLTRAVEEGGVRFA